MSHRSGNSQCRRRNSGLLINAQARSTQTSRPRVTPVLARTGTLGAWDWKLHNTISGPDGDKQRGKSPWVSWIWTINGAGHNVLQVTPRTWGSPVSRLAELVETGHPDAEGKARIDLSWDERQRVYRWIDLNVPYYGTSSSNHKQRMGRRMYPTGLDRVLADV